MIRALMSRCVFNSHWFSWVDLKNKAHHFTHDVSWKAFGVKPCEFTLWISMKWFRCTTYDITPTAVVWSFIRLNFSSSRRCHVVLRDRFIKRGKWQFWGQKPCSAVCRFHLKCVQRQLVLIVSSDVFIKMFWWVTKWQHCCCLGNLELPSPFEIVHFELGKRHQLLRKDDEG